MSIFQKCLIECEVWIIAKWRTLLFLIGSVLFFYSWFYIFRENEWMRVFGASVFPVLWGSLSFFWIFKAYRTITGKQKYFWLLLSIGILFYIFADAFWFLYFILEGETHFPGSTYLFWLLAYIFFLTALTYKVKLISIYIKNNHYLFNIIIFMISAAAISVHYLMEPIILHSEFSFYYTIINLAYPITSLSILFVITCLYYFSQFSNEKRIMLFIVVGFFLQVISDTSYAYFELIGQVHAPGNYIDPIWLTALILIGLSGKFAQGNQRKPKWEIRNIFNGQEAVFPYLSSIILIVLVTHSYNWDLNALSIGLIVIFVLILVRHYVIIRKNEYLVNEYRELAYHDSLTGLNNRTSFQNDLEQIVNQAAENNKNLALLLIDLDRFKIVNDTLGHHIGDNILKEASERLSSVLGTDESLYRLGGDEFVLILSNSTKKRCIELSKSIKKAFVKPFFVERNEITITPSIGICSYPEHGTNSETLLKNADAAMYLAKGRGGNGFHFFSSGLHDQLARKMLIETELRHAIDRKQFTLYYQPKIELQSEKLVGMEALLRWDHPELGRISPVEFISVAEETGQIIAIGEWVIRVACKQNKAWQEIGYPSLCVSVNVSVRQFQHGDFIETVRNALQETGLKAEFLELEITESILQNVEESKAVLIGLREIGVKTSIDDFGTGYSSLHILKELPIDTLKIDKSFIDDIIEGSDESMVKTIIDIGSNLNLSIVAEGIEHEKQVEILTKYNCGFGQGYLFLRPIHAEGFEKYLKDCNMVNNI
ncbi:putative bifunctional diguanylate cyclase/phosphodiesterase [Salipaludibacillus sp. HK11]|uniref:putative bifunctional diguanylate cyclase/phosphodiesterase n=1 Tax=Salipaludibacillus sp. HK11 TaxID=3394320 RepID=UPI0039FC797F